jgi:hypothetical protein
MYAGKCNKHRAQEAPMKLKKIRRVGNCDNLKYQLDATR